MQKNNYSNGNMKDAEEKDISLSRNYAGLRLEEIGTYETKERCLEIIDEIQKVSVSYLYSAGSPGFLKGAPAFPPFAAEIPRIYEMPEK